MKRAFTLLEILVCIGIIAILASIAFPILSKSMLAAKEKRSYGQLRQIYVGLMLYREQNDAKVEFGPIEAMGMPEALPLVTQLVVANRDTWRSPCCCHQDAPRAAGQNQTDFAWLAIDPVFWNRYVIRTESSAVLLADYHCTPRSVDLYRPYYEMARGTGVRLDGSISSRNRTISISTPDEFWN